MGAVAVDKKKEAISACLLALLLPGAGHFYLGRRVKGVILLSAVGLLFVLGVVMDSRMQVDIGLDDILASLFSLAQMAVGLPYLAVRALGLGAGLPTSVTYEYGNTFTAVAGLLNMLLIIDAYDTAIGRKQ